MHLEETLKHATTLENIALRCIYSEYYFTMTTDHDGEFWPIVQNSLGESVCILWAHVFGNRSDDLHYSNFFNRDNVKSIGNKYTAESIKERILLKIDMNEAEYKLFWQEVKECRDMYVAHKQISATSIIFPYIDKCRIMMEEIRNILEELMNHWNESNPNIDEIMNFVEYYAWNKNKYLLSKSSKAFEKDIKSIALNITNK